MKNLKITCRARKTLYSLLLCAVLVFSGCVTTSDQHALETANSKNVISVKESDERVSAAIKNEQSKFSEERNASNARIKNLEYMGQCLRADSNAGLLGYKNSYPLVIGKVFEVQQKRLSIFEADNETTGMWDLAIQAFKSGNIEGVNQITGKVLNKADETAKENGELKIKLETAKKNTDEATKETNQIKIELTNKISSLQKELEENQKKNEKILQETIKNLTDENVKNQQKSLNFGAGACLLAGFVLIGLRLWLGIKTGKWALIAFCAAPFLFWLSQIIGQSWFMLGFGGGLAIILAIVLLVIVKDSKEKSEQEKKEKELNNTKSVAQKLVSQIKSCDDDTKTRIADIVAQNPNMTVSDFTSKFVLDKLNMTKEEVAQVNFIKGEAKLNSEEDKK